MEDLPPDDVRRKWVDDMQVLAENMFAGDNVNYGGRGTRTTERTKEIGFEDKLWRAADKLRSNMDAAEYARDIRDAAKQSEPLSLVCGALTTKRACYFPRWSQAFPNLSRHLHRSPNPADRQRVCRKEMQGNRSDSLTENRPHAPSLVHLCGLLELGKYLLCPVHPDLPFPHHPLCY